MHAAPAVDDCLPYFYLSQLSTGLLRLSSNYSHFSLNKVRRALLLLLPPPPALSNQLHFLGPPNRQIPLSKAATATVAILRDRLLLPPLSLLDETENEVPHCIPQYLSYDGRHAGMACLDWEGTGGETVRSTVELASE